MDAVLTSRILLGSFLLWAGIAQATVLTNQVTVGSKAGPWAYTNGGLNTAYQYGLHDQTAPTIVSTTNGFDFTAGLTLTIQYVSGTVAASSPGYPFVDALGQTNSLANNSVDIFNGSFPTYYVSSSNYPTYLVELIGTFATTNGSIVGTPFPVGNLKTVTIPAGATQLQLGVNDNKYADNLGSWSIQITGTAIPEPSTIVLAGLAVVPIALALRRQALPNKTK